MDIERDNEIKISMEIIVDTYEYNAKEKYFHVKDYRYTGVTMLNSNYGTGMENARAIIGEFEKNDTKEKFIMLMNELKTTLSYSQLNGGEDMDKTVNFEDNLVEEEVEEVLETEVETEISTEEYEETDVEVLETETDTEEVVETGEVENVEEQYIKTFAISHEDIKFALYNLLSVNESEDNEWYFIDAVYDDFFEYENWYGTKIYRQPYQKDGDNVAFTNNRIELWQERLTAQEKNVLDEMRKNYSKIEELQAEVDSLKEFKSQKELAEKEAVFAKFNFTDEEIKEIRENIDSYSVDQLEEKLFALWGKKVMNEGLNTFSTNEQEKLVFALADTNETGKPIYSDIVQKHKKAK